MNKDRVHWLNEIGIALSKERRIPFLLEEILVGAKELTHADGGTLYTVSSNQTLKFETLISDSLHIHIGGSSGLAIPFSNLFLFLENGEPNESLVVTYSVNHKKTVNVKDAYYEQGFDFSGTRLFDEKTGYRTQAVLTVPMKNHEDDVIAVLQLINPKGENKFFTKEDQQLAESLASQAGIALNNQLLISQLQKLFESLIQILAESIDERSPSTSNHGKRVPLITQLFAEGVNETHEGPLKKVYFSEKQRHELQVAALLHDCGKITTPDHIIEKKTKLEGLHDRIETINTRLTVLEREVDNRLLSKKLHWFETHLQEQPNFSLYEKEAAQEKRQIEENRAFLNRCNRGEEPMTEEAISRIYKMPFLSGDEKEHLSIPKGNLTEQERKKVENHVVMTYRMLSRLHYPKDLQEVPEIAASHHERVDGKGYPRGLKKEEMSIRARLLAIADVFEALSAPDRSYKETHLLSEVLDIMKDMVLDGHLDPDLFDVFLKKKIYLQYARQYLMPEQIDID
ncbi:MAG: HD domain-containing phosphohydrolase [Chlamydiales bacterium]